MSGSGASAPPPTRREIVAGIRAELEAGGVEAAAMEAERLACFALGIERHALVTEGPAPIDPGSLHLLGRLVRRRLGGEPLQHIEGTTAFRDLLLVADSRALVPRPETEQLVDLVGEWVRERAGGGGGGDGVRVVRRDPGAGHAFEPVDLALDVGTGSGAIALSLVHEGIARAAVGVDVSAAALTQAEENRARCALEGAVDLRLVPPSIWEGVGPEERFQVIVSNPPYVRDDEMAGLAADVREHEPAVALRGGADGLEIVRRVIDGAPPHLAPGGALFLEIGPEQGARVLAWLAEGVWRDVVLRQDYAGRARFVVARAP